MEIACQKLEFDALERLSEVLADAFRNDPVVNVTFQHHHENQALMLFMLKYFNQFGEIHSTQDFSGVALWLPPDVQFLSITDALTTRIFKNFLPVLRAVSWRSFMKLSQFSFYTSPKHPHEPHYYLFAIGVRSDQQGRGIGKHLMQYAVRKFGENQLYYLENSNRNNLPFYRGLHFNVKAEGEFRGAKLFFMTRQNGTASQQKKSPSESGAR